jgi:hypothetical protein
MTTAKTRREGVSKMMMTCLREKGLKLSTRGKKIQLQQREPIASVATLNEQAEFSD